MYEYNKDGNIIIHGKSYYEKQKVVVPKLDLSYQEAKNRKLENEDIVKVTDKQKEFSKKVRQYRQNQNLTQKQLAHMCQVKPDVIQKIEINALIPENKLVQTLRRVLKM